MIIQHATDKGLGFIVLRLDIHHDGRRIGYRHRIQRRVVEVPDCRVRKTGSLQVVLRPAEIGTRNTGHPACDKKIGLEGINRRPQRLQCIGHVDRRRAEQSDRDTGEQFALTQPLLNQTCVGIDRARQRGLSDGQFLVVNLHGSETGKDQSDDRHQSDDETETEHAITRKGEGMKNDTGRRGRPCKNRRCMQIPNCRS